MSNKVLPLLSVVGMDCLVEVLDNFYQISTELAYLADSDGKVIAQTQLANSPFLGQEEQRLVTVAGCESFIIHLQASSTSNTEGPSSKNCALLDSLERILRLEILSKLQNHFRSSLIDKTPLQLIDVLQASPMAVGWSNALTDEIEYINPAFEKLFGYDHAEIPTLRDWFEKAFPDEDYRETMLMPWYDASREAQKQGDFTQTCTLDVVCRDGSKRHVELNVTYIGNRRLVNFMDVTDYFYVQERLKIHTKLLEMVAKGEHLKHIMLALIEHVQCELPGSIGSVLLMDEDQRLRSYIAPKLPPAYLKAIDGIPPGPALGSCGTAAYLKERVIVENIYQSPYWKSFTHLADIAGVKACWSDPILSSSGEVLGTFAIYYPYPASPTQKNIELIDFASNLASVAIENRRGQQALEKRAYFDHLTGLSNRGHFFESAEQALQQLNVKESWYCMLMLDIDHFKRVNDRYGHKAGDKVLLQVAQVMLRIVDDVDLIGRIGGEEFAIMLPNTNKREAQVIAEKIRQSVELLQVSVAPEQNVRVTISIGIAQCHEEGEAVISIDRLFGRADEALYQAKFLGRNRVEVFSKEYR